MKHERLRGRAGVKQRARRIRLYPLCAQCKAEGRTTAADHIDHIVPLSQGGPDTDANCQGLCAEHHKSKTIAEAKGVQHGFTEEGKPLDPKHPWAVNADQHDAP